MGTQLSHEAASLEYATNVPYLRTFSNDLSPAVLGLVAALNGFPSPPADDFDYLELGCGNGDTLLTLAASYPGARFVGIDLNAAHIAFARDLADRGGLTNVRFLQGDFADLEAGSLPSFHYVGCFGLLSWVSAAARHAAMALAGQKLAEGGCFFASYNAMPGWAAVAPLRRLMLDAAAGGEGDPLARAHRGVTVAGLLEAAGALYFKENPAAKDMLERLRQAGLSYAVHEYFLPDWHPMYFEDVARELAAERLHFVGQLPLHLNYRDLCIPPSLRPLFETVTHRITFESLKDFALNEFFRRDVFMKGAIGQAAETTQRYLDETRFGTLVLAEDVLRVVPLSHYTLRFSGPIFDVLLPALAARASSVSELSGLPALAGYDRAQIRDAVLHLALGQQAVPMRRLPPLAVGDGPLVLSERYNRVVLEPPFTDNPFFVLASTALGTGVVLSPLEARCLRALTGCDQGSGSIPSPEEIEAFTTRRLPKLAELGLVHRGHV